MIPAVGQAVYFRDRVSWQSPVRASEMVTVEQARAWGDNVIWIDARPEEDFARGHVPNAISLNEDRYSELLPQFQAIWSPDKKVVVYCSEQSCNASRQVAERLRKSTEPPMHNVFVLEGGWDAWLRSK